jgi:hypothetical protein
MKLYFNVSYSAKGLPLYEVNLETLQAKQMAGEQNLHIYDLASKYFANDKAVSNTAFANLDIYPTRVDEHFINVNVNDRNVKGNIKMNVFDLSGKNVMKQNLSVKEGSLNQQVYLKNLVSGAYLVSITDESGKILLNKKILVTE